MAEDIKRTAEEISDEELQNVNGGFVECKALQIDPKPLPVMTTQEAEIRKREEQLSKGFNVF